MTRCLNTLFNLAGLISEYVKPLFYFHIFYMKEVKDILLKKKAKKQNKKNYLSSIYSIMLNVVTVCFATSKLVIVLAWFL